MEFTNLIIPPRKNICRTCIEETDIIMNLDDFVVYDINKVKLSDVLEFLGCMEKRHDEMWPQGVCEMCVTNALTAYSFKLSCLKANSALSQILIVQSSSQISHQDDAININVVHQDHEYDVPFFNNPSMFDIAPNISLDENTLPPIQIIENQEVKKLNRTESEKKFSCTLCTQSFTRIYGLREHMEKHTGLLKYLCQKCGKFFGTSGSLRQHYISHENRVRYKCSYCKNMYKSRQSLRVHIRVAHSNNRYSYSCTDCGKVFTAKHTLLMHMKTHTGIREFHCPDCPKTYTRAAYLRKHRLTHAEQVRKPFNCDENNCDRNFATKYSL